MQHTWPIPDKHWTIWYIQITFLCHHIRELQPLKTVRILDHLYLKAITFTDLTHRRLSTLIQVLKNNS